MRCLVLLIAVLASGFPAFAQTDRANVTGGVTDPSQGAVPGARVSLHSLATGSERSALTNGAGVYTFSALPVGQYEISITAEGFQELRIQDFSLDVGETRTLNANLRVAAVSTDVTVVGATPDLNVTLSHPRLQRGCSSKFGSTADLCSGFSWIVERSSSSWTRPPRPSQDIPAVPSST